MQTCREDLLHNRPGLACSESDCKYAAKPVGYRHMKRPRTFLWAGSPVEKPHTTQAHGDRSSSENARTWSTRAPAVRPVTDVMLELKGDRRMAKKLSKRSISELMAWWGRKGGSRATQAQKNAARDNLKKTPNYQKHEQRATNMRERRPSNVRGGGQKRKVGQKVDPGERGLRCQPMTDRGGLFRGSARRGHRCAHQPAISA